MRGLVAGGKVEGMTGRMTTMSQWSSSSSFGGSIEGHLQPAARDLALAPGLEWAGPQTPNPGKKAAYLGTP